MSRIKKVAFIEPKPPGYHVYSRVALPRLGLPLLGAMLKQRGIEVSIYCQDIAEIDYDDVLRSDLVGISTTTSTVPEAYRIAQQVRGAGIPVMMGGAHVSFMADEALNYSDYCVRGEGEYTLLELIDAIEAGSGFESINGLSYKLGDDTRHNPPRELLTDLDSLPFPDLSLIRGHEKIGITPIATSRGCPFDCSFCSVVKMFGRNCRKRSVENVIEELRMQSPDQIFFYDDNFTADRERTKRLLEAMLSNGITPRWTAQARTDVVKDAELMELMKRSNCFMLYLGLESVNPETLKEYNKRQSVEEIEDSIRILHENGIMAHGMFVFGAENDDARSLRSTVDFALKNHIDTVQFLVLTPLPGTDYFSALDEQGRLLTKEWHLYDGQHVVYHPNRMSPYELQKETFKAMKRFYSLRECLKMICGLDFFRFAVRVNKNLLLGRWQSVESQMSARAIKWFYRAYGHILLRRFEAANKDFGERIKALAQKASELRPHTKSSQKESSNVR